MTRVVNIGPVCGCAECHAHDVAAEPTRRVPAQGQGKSRWIHGRELRQWLDAKAAFERQARALAGPRGRRGRMERLLTGGQG